MKKKYYAYIVNGSVAPRAGAWIETDQNLCRSGLLRSLSVRERELQIHLKAKTYAGTSENALYIQIWTAMKEFIDLERRLA
jgi:hypothetical protein